MTRGALVLAGAQTSPSDEVSGGEKAAHVAADLRQDGGGGQAADAGDRAQQRDQSPKAGLTGSHLRIQLGDRGVDLAVDLFDRRAPRPAAKPGRSPDTAYPTWPRTH